MGGAAPSFIFSPKATPPGAKTRDILIAKIVLSCIFSWCGKQSFSQQEKVTFMTKTLTARDAINQE